MQAERPHSSPNDVKIRLLPTSRMDNLKIGTDIQKPWSKDLTLASQHLVVSVSILSTLIHELSQKPIAIEHVSSINLFERTLELLKRKYFIYAHLVDTHAQLKFSGQISINQKRINQAERDVQRLEGVLYRSLNTVLQIAGNDINSLYQNLDEDQQATLDKALQTLSPEDLKLYEQIEHELIYFSQRMQSAISSVLLETNKPVAEKA